MAKPPLIFTFYIAAPTRERLERVCVEGDEPDNLYGC